MMTKQKKRAGSEELFSSAVASVASNGCSRRLASQTIDGISRSRLTMEKDPTVHPETPRNNPDPG